MGLPLQGLFAGQPIFGDLGSFSSRKLQGDYSATALYNSQLPLNIDAFLGLTPGTTKFGPIDNGGVWAVSGVFYDLSPQGIATQQSFLLGFANTPSLWLRPTGYQWPANAEYWKNSIFRPQEVVFSPTATAAGNQYTCSYNMIIRTLGNS